MLYILQAQCQLQLSGTELYSHTYPFHHRPTHSQAQSNLPVIKTSPLQQRPNHGLLIADNLKFVFVYGWWPQFCFVNGELPHIYGTWKATSFFVNGKLANFLGKWKNTSHFNYCEDSRWPKLFAEQNWLGTDPCLCVIPIHFLIFHDSFQI